MFGDDIDEREAIVRDLDARLRVVEAVIDAMTRTHEEIAAGLRAVVSPADKETSTPR